MSVSGTFTTSAGAAVGSWPRCGDHRSVLILGSASDEDRGATLEHGQFPRPSGFIPAGESLVEQRSPPWCGTAPRSVLGMIHPWHLAGPPARAFAEALARRRITTDRPFSVLRSRSSVPLDQFPGASGLLPVLQSLVVMHPFALMVDLSSACRTVHPAHLVSRRPGHPPEASVPEDAFPFGDSIHRFRCSSSPVGIRVTAFALVRERSPYLGPKV